MKKSQEEFQEKEIIQDAEGDVAEQEAEAVMSDEDAQMQVLALMSENQEFNNRLLRLQADFENFKRRTRTERDDLLKYANFELVQKLLPIVDNFARAIQSNEGQGDKVLQGVTMIYRQLTETLEKEGLNEIETVGKEFDPNLHDAVMQEDSEEFEDNTIMVELQKGYLYKDKLLRPAMVKVCKK